jgi:hypothetical protein
MYEPYVAGKVAPRRLDEEKRVDACVVGDSRLADQSQGPRFSQWRVVRSSQYCSFECLRSSQPPPITYGTPA